MTIVADNHNLYTNLIDVQVKCEGWCPARYSSAEQSWAFQMMEKTTTKNNVHTELKIFRYVVRKQEESERGVVAAGTDRVI